MPLKPIPIKSGATWSRIMSAIFGALTLVGLFVIVLLSGPQREYVCNSLLPLAAVFALGSGFVAGFMGGAAALEGNFSPVKKGGTVVVSAGGGVAVLFIALYLLHQFQPNYCTIDVSSLQQQHNNDQTSIENLTQQHQADQSAIVALTQQIAVLQKQGVQFVITPDSAPSLPLNGITVKYYDHTGLPTDADQNGNLYSILSTDLNFASNIFVTFKP